MNRTKPSFTSGEKKKIKRVIDLFRQQVRDIMESNDGPYNNDVGCGNCGDLGPTFKTIHALEVLFGLAKKS